MNPFSTTKVKPETRKEEKNKYVSYILVPAVKERAVFESMNHGPRFPKEKLCEKKKWFSCQIYWSFMKIKCFHVFMGWSGEEGALLFISTNAG